MPDDLTDEMMRDRIRALLEERAAHPERAGSVDAELRRLGHEAEPPAKRAAKRPANTDAAKR